MTFTTPHFQGAAALILTLLTATSAAAQEGAVEPDVAAPARPAAPRPVPRGVVAKPAAKPAVKPIPAPTADTGPARPVWPEGASMVSETYGDWTMTCSRAEAKATCLLLQSQGNARTGKREFAVELKPPVDGRAEGMIMMPFGFRIEPGVSFKLDETVLGKGAPYVSCSLEGCLVPISLPTLATDTMKTARILSVIGTKQDAKEPTTVAVPLSGFGPALARAVALGN